MLNLPRRILADAELSPAPPKAGLRYAALVVASSGLVLVFAAPPLLGSILDDSRVLGMGTDELNAMTTFFVSAGVLFLGYIAQVRTSAEPAEEPIDVDEIIESLRAFEENEAHRIQERQTLHFDEFRFRD
jgi:hypothetical protein